MHEKNTNSFNSFGRRSFENREKWIGLEIPVISDNIRRRAVGILTREPCEELSDGYAVLTAKALKALEKVSTETVSWWTSVLRPIDYELIFDRGCCEIIDDEEIAVSE